MIGGDFDTPIVYQDLANSTLPTMGMPMGMYGYGTGMYGGMVGGTSYLGGVRMQQQPDRDKVEIMNKKEKEDTHTLKNTLIVLGTIVALGCIAPLRKSIKKAGGVKKYFASTWDSIKNAFKGKKKTP